MRNRRMRFPAVIVPLLVVTSCVPVSERGVPPLTGVAQPVPVAAKAELPSRPPDAPRATSGEYSGMGFEGVAFDSRSHRLVIADQDGSPGSRFPDAAAAARSRGGLAALNGGFFTPAGEPLGLVISSGKSAGAWNTASSLGSGMWHEDAAGQSAISRREALGGGATPAMRELLQAGPMLLENRRSISGLDAGKSSVRSLILWDGGSRWWLGRTSACTLTDLSASLVRSQPAGWPIRFALNLDGGRSSELWISGALAGGPVSRRPPWNRPVRNFLVLMPR